MLAHCLCPVIPWKKSPAGNLHREIEKGAFHMKRNAKTNLPGLALAGFLGIFLLSIILVFIFLPTINELFQHDYGVGQLLLISVIAGLAGAAWVCLSSLQRQISKLEARLAVLEGAATQPDASQPQKDNAPQA